MSAMTKTKVKVKMIPDADNPAVPPASKKVLPHYKELPITDDMAEGTRNFAIQYNTMRATLIENKLMKPK